MRKCRARRRNGAKCFRWDVPREVVEALIRKGWLKAWLRDDLVGERNRYARSVWGFPMAKRLGLPVAFRVCRQRMQDVHSLHAPRE